MTHVAEATIVKCPPEHARAFVLEYLKGLAVSNQGQAVLRLKGGMTPSGLHLEHDVDVALVAVRTDPLEYRINVSWKPRGTALLPSFVGTLRFQWDEEYGNTYLVVEGDYEPPMGAAGKAFDAIAGQRIARGTLRALLDDLRAVIETARTGELGKS